MIFRRTSDIEKSLIREMYEKADEKCIDMSIGIPYLRTPPLVKEAGIAAIRSDKTFYTENRGIGELRRVVAERFKENHNKRIDENSVLVNVGSTEALFSVMFSVIMPGDGVLIPDPGYPAYEYVAKMLGAEIVKYKSALNPFESEYESIKEMYKENIKVVIINSPANPTGRVIPVNNIIKIADFLRDRDVLVISDEIYSGIVYEGRFTSIADFLPFDKCAVISGASKSYGMTGWRIGWTISSKGNVTEFNKSHMYAVSCVPSVSQYAALEALSDRSLDTYALDAMKSNMKAAISALYDINSIRIIPPDGAIFVFADVSKIADGKEVAYDLLEKEKVITVPGIGFGDRGKNYIRISVGMEPNLLEEGLKRLKHYFSSK